MIIIIIHYQYIRAYLRTCVLADVLRDAAPPLPPSLQKPRAITRVHVHVCT